MKIAARKNAKKEILNRLAFVTALDSQPIVDGIKSSIEKIFKRAGMPDSELDSLDNSNLDGNSFLYMPKESDCFYDYLISSKKASVVGIKLQEDNWFNMVFPDYGAEIRICIELRCELPEDDLMLFEAMGKVDTEYSPASTTKRVFCAF